MSRKYCPCMMRPILTILAVALIANAFPAFAADHSPTLDNLIAATPVGEPVPVILFLDQRLTMDDVYPVARSLPMSERRQYVVQVLRKQFEEMSPRIMGRLEDAKKAGQVTILRPLWIINAIRVSATAEVISVIDRDYSEVYYIAADPQFENTLDNAGWGVTAMGAPRVWSNFGADGSGVIVGHKDAGLDWDHPGFAGHIWINPGEDMNGSGDIEPEEVNGIDDDGNGYIDDFRGWGFDDDNNDVTDDPSAGSSFGHGTKSGSIISANFSPCDTTCVAPGAKLMVLRGFWTQGAVFESSQYAILMGANVISASLSFKQSNCDAIRECPNYVAHRWVSEMELAAGLIHANSTGNTYPSQGAVPLGVPAPANSPPPAMTPAHEQQGRVSSIVSVAAYYSNGQHHSGSGRGPSAWSRADICVHPRMPFCEPDGQPGAYPPEFEDYPYEGATFPGLAKPDITAPRDVPTLNPGGGCFGSFTGTSAATPHIGGALALIYSAFPGITPEDAYLVLMNGAEDAGDVGFDSTWGFGKVKIFRSCSTGVAQRATLTGTVQDQNNNDLEGVRVSTDSSQSVYTNSVGQYELSLEAGDYTILFDKYGYQDITAQVNLPPGWDEGLNAQMPVAAAASAHGTVTAGGAPLSGISVNVPEADLTVTTDVNGAYLFANLYAGAYAFVVGGLPWETVTSEMTVAPGDNLFDFQLARSLQAFPSGPDQYGYRIYDRYDAAFVYDWVEISPSQGGSGTTLGISENNSTVVNLPVTLRFYGQDYTSISVADNGFVMLGSSSSGEWGPYTIPHVEPPNAFVAPFYTDWLVNSGGNISYYVDAANHRVIVEWYNMPDFLGIIHGTFEVIFAEPGFPPTPTNDSQITCQYKRVNGHFPGLIGIENPSGTDGIQYEFVGVRDLHAAPIDSGCVLVITTDSTLLVEEGALALPREFSLEPNFPNPFNPSTTFVWNVPRAANVRLALYNVLGREAAVVFEGRCEAGRFEKTFDATALTTGVYFARLESGERSWATRKVLLLK